MFVSSVVEAGELMGVIKQEYTRTSIRSNHGRCTNADNYETQPRSLQRGDVDLLRNRTYVVLT